MARCPPRAWVEGHIGKLNALGPPSRGTTRPGSFALHGATTLVGCRPCRRDQREPLVGGGRSDAWVSGGSSTAALRGHAVRLGLATQHLSRQRSQNPIDVAQEPDLSHLRRAGSLLAASWFMLRGRDVAWPLEPCPYDLLVSGQGTTQRVQVKTTTRQRGGTWLVRISRHTGPGGPATPYAPEDIDSFFIIDGDLTCFWIPLAVVGGLCELSLAAYDGFRVGSARSLIEHLT